MTENDATSHPDLDVLAEYAAGTLAQRDAPPVERHLPACLECRIELARIRRFAQIERDEALSAEAEWPNARAALERAYRTTIGPAARARAHRAREHGAASHRSIWPRWLGVPAAAAAALALTVLAIDRLDVSDRSEGDGAYRGAAAEAIVPLSPAGPLTETPRAFAWRADGEFDSFVLEVYSPELEIVFTRPEIAGTMYAAGDSLLALLEPGRTYHWSVHGVRRFSSSIASAPAWFTLPPARARR